MTVRVMIEAAVFVGGCMLSALAGGLAMRRAGRHTVPVRRSTGASPSNCRVLLPSETGVPLFDQDRAGVPLRPLPWCLSDRLDPDRSAS
jgi:hypothetical protein